VSGPGTSVRRLLPARTVLLRRRNERLTLVRDDVERKEAGAIRNTLAPASVLRVRGTRSDDAANNSRSDYTFQEPAPGGFWKLGAACLNRLTGTSLHRAS